eukprot:10458351-Prorocentrum_lima.AAC.1
MTQEATVPRRGPAPSNPQVRLARMGLWRLTNQNGSQTATSTRRGCGVMRCPQGVAYRHPLAEHRGVDT